MTSRCRWLISARIAPFLSATTAAPTQVGKPRRIQETALLQPEGKPSIMKNKNMAYLVASLAATVAVVALTLLIYGTFFQDILEEFTELSPRVEKLIERDSPNLVAIALANLAHGFFIATVIRWGKFYAPLRGATAGAVVACLTEIYFLFTQYSLFKTMTLASAVLDTMMWTLINAIVGALVAWILGRSAGRGFREGRPLEKGSRVTPSPRPLGSSKV